MNPTQKLPENYALAWSLNLKRDTRIYLWLNLAGVPWLVLVSWGLSVAFSAIWSTGIAQVIDLGLGAVLGLLLALLVSIVLHELVHGLFFWLFAQQPPKFGIGPGYAYAAMPDWYFPKNQYLVIGLSPLVGLTGLGLALLALIPASWIPFWFVLLVMNAAGAIGDLYVCLRIAREAADVWVRDQGDGFEVFRQIESASHPV